jgi:tetratricopeptide (TPR) repeat protein
LLESLAQDPDFSNAVAKVVHTALAMGQAEERPQETEDLLRQILSVTVFTAIVEHPGTGGRSFSSDEVVTYFRGRQTINSGHGLVQLQLYMDGKSQSKGTKTKTTGLRVRINCPGSSNLTVEIYSDGYVARKEATADGGLTFAMDEFRGPPGSFRDRSIEETIDGTVWKLLRHRAVGKDGEAAVSGWEEAYRLCRRAVSLQDWTTNPETSRLLDQADALSDVCAEVGLARLVQSRTCWGLQMAREGEDSASPEAADRVGADQIAFLKAAVRAGEKAMTLVDGEKLFTHEHGEQNFFNWVPSRGYLRALFRLGALYCVHEDYASAEQYLNRTIGHNPVDDFGARHYLLKVYLNTGRGPGTRECNHLMQSTYGYPEKTPTGEDNMGGPPPQDTMLATWTYTRALHEFASSGNSDEARGLLEHAIIRNGFVPRVLLGHEIAYSDCVQIEIGWKDEASVYTYDFGKFWALVEGSIEWLETVYGGLCGPDSGICTTDQTTSNVRAGVRLMNQYRTDLALPFFESSCERILPLDDLFVLSNECLSLCYTSSDRYVDTIRVCDRILRHNPFHKQSRYNRGKARMETSDFTGAIEDYEFVLENIGPYPSAVQGLNEVKIKMGLSIVDIASEHTSRFPAKQGKLPGERASMKRKAKVQAEAEAAMWAARETAPGGVAEFFHAPAEDLDSTNIPGCRKCHRTGVKLDGCGGCKSVRYCSKECQTADWAAHKKPCKLKRKEKKRAGAGAAGAGAA